MATKEYLVEDLVVTVHKRKGARSLRLTVGSNRKIKVTIPSWAPFKVGEEFAKSRYEWLITQLNGQRSGTLRSGQAIGKGHHLLLKPVASKTISTRVKTGTILISYPPDKQADHPEVQAAAQKASMRALKAQGERLLPVRTQQLADTYGFSFADISVKQLKRRWGSCDSKKRLVFNLFLMQLPWELIDYVILHELAHTKHLNHGQDFWDEMERVLPGAKAKRKLLKGYQAELFAA